MRIIVATKNKGKLKEIKDILRGTGIKAVGLYDLDRQFKIIENGKTFQANALKKAQAVSKFYKDDYIVGEDSGLMVHHLKGSPGVKSRRFSGTAATDDKNNRKLLKLLGDLPAAKRKACYCCSMALVKNNKLLALCTGKLSGRIYDKCIGKNGFGYDPIFYLSKYNKTAAQLPLKEKNRISHRSVALKELKVYLKRLSRNS